jgi:hypothetical protein
LLLSLTLAIISAVDAIRGSVVVTPPPERVLLFRDGGGKGAVLWLAVKQSFINVAGPDHGDLVRSAVLHLVQPGGKTSDFTYASLLEPVMSSDSKAAESRCDLDARCVPLDGLLVVDRSDRLLDLAGGAARSEYLGFTLVRGDCVGGTVGCAAFADFASAARAVGGRPLDLVLEVRFQRDGKRRLTCRTRPVDAAYLEKVGWTSLACS